MQAYTSNPTENVLLLTEGFGILPKTDLTKPRKLLNPELSKET